MIPYRHTQIGTTILWGMLAVACTMVVALVIVLPQEWLAILPALIAIAVTAMLFWKLTVTVNENTLCASFGPGLIRKEVPVAQVQSCMPMRVRWWHGWGIHLTGNGWLYNVAGRDAVIITLRTGKRFCLGTDQPDELIAAIRRFASAR